MAYEEYILTHIVEPLGMKDTSFVVPRDKLARLCVVAEWQEEAAYVPADRTGRPPLAGNGLYSTLHDLYLLGQMMLGGGSLNGMRILSRKSVEAMTRNQLGREVANNCWGGHSESYRFGLGLSLHDERPHSPGTYSHEGYGHCALFVDPKEKLVAAYLVPSIEGYHIESVVNTRQIIWSGIRSEAVIN